MKSKTWVLASFGRYAIGIQYQLMCYDVKLGSNNTILTINKGKSDFLNNVMQITFGDYTGWRCIEAGKPLIEGYIIMVYLYVAHK